MQKQNECLSSEYKIEKANGIIFKQSAKMAQFIG